MPAPSNRTIARMASATGLAPRRRRAADRQPARAAGRRPSRSDRARRARGRRASPRRPRRSGSARIPPCVPGPARTARRSARSAAAPAPGPPRPARDPAGDPVGEVRPARSRALGRRSLGGSSRCPWPGRARPEMSSTAPVAATTSSVSPSALTAVDRIVWFIVSPVARAAAMIVVPSISPTTISAERPGGGRRCARRA